MGGPEWSAEEDALVVFFVSSGVFEKVVADLLTQRGYRRTQPAVHYRIATLKNAYKLGEARQWHQDLVERWLIRHLKVFHVAINKLQPTEADQRAVQQAQASIDLQSAYDRLSQKFLRDLEEEWEQQWFRTAASQWPHRDGGYYN